MDLVGCDTTTLIEHLRSLFKVGMTIDNYGTVWEIDHIKPCALFDLANEGQQRACFHFSNLQPLFKSENRQKWSKYSVNSVA